MHALHVALLAAIINPQNLPYQSDLGSRRTLYYYMASAVLQRGVRLINRRFPTPLPAFCNRPASTVTSDLRVIAGDVRDGFASSVGNTPLVRLRKISKETGCEVGRYSD